MVPVAGVTCMSCEQPIYCLAAFPLLPSTALFVADHDAASGDALRR